MANQYRGVGGQAYQGGAIVGVPLLKGDVAQAATSATIDGVGLNGVVRPADTFTVAGDGQTYTIATGGVIGAVVANELDITFSPGVVPVGGWDENAVVTFASNAVAQVTSFELSLERAWLDTTAQGDTAESGTLDVQVATARVEVLLDYGDVEQKALLDQVSAGTAATALALTLAIAAGKQFWGDFMITSSQIVSQRGAIVTARLALHGTGAIAKNWN